MQAAGLLARPCTRRRRDVLAMPVHGSPGMACQAPPSSNAAARPQGSPLPPPARAKGALLAARTSRSSAVVPGARSRPGVGCAKNRGLP